LGFGPQDFGIRYVSLNAEGGKVMESLKKYNEYVNSFHERKTVLEEEKVKHERHFALFSAELETAQLLKDEKRIAKAQAGVDLLIGRLKTVNADLEGMNIRPLAEQVLFESEEIKNQLHRAVEQQWQRAREARILFLRELEELGNLRRKSQELSWATLDAMKALRRNPLEPIGYGVNRLEFLVEQNIIDNLLKK
jgi:hypothetical protein